MFSRDVDSYPLRVTDLDSEEVFEYARSVKSPPFYMVVHDNGTDIELKRIDNARVEFMGDINAREKE